MEEDSMQIKGWEQYDIPFLKQPKFFPIKDKIQCNNSDQTKQKTTLIKDNKEQKLKSSNTLPILNKMYLKSENSVIDKSHQKKIKNKKLQQQPHFIPHFIDDTSYCFDKSSIQSKPILKTKYYLETIDLNNANSQFQLDKVNRVSEKMARYRQKKHNTLQQQSLQILRKKIMKSKILNRQSDQFKDRSILLKVLSRQYSNSPKHSHHSNHQQPSTKISRIKQKNQKDNNNRNFHVRKQSNEKSKLDHKDLFIEAIKQKQQTQLSSKVLSEKYKNIISSAQNLKYKKKSFKKNKVLPLNNHIKRNTDITGVLGSFQINQLSYQKNKILFDNSMLSILNNKNSNQGQDVRTMNKWSQVLKEVQNISKNIAFMKDSKHNQGAQKIQKNLNNSNKMRVNTIYKEKKKKKNPLNVNLIDINNSGVMDEFNDEILFKND